MTIGSHPIEHPATQRRSQVPSASNGSNGARHPVEADAPDLEIIPDDAEAYTRHQWLQREREYRSIDSIGAGPAIAAAPIGTDLDVNGPRDEQAVHSLDAGIGTVLPDSSHADVNPGIDAILKQIRRADAHDGSVRNAVNILSPLIQQLPATEHFLVRPESIAAWRIVRDEDPEIYLVFRSYARQHGRSPVVELVDRMIGPPRTIGERRDIVLLSPVDLCGQEIPLDLLPGWLPSGPTTGVIVGATQSGKSFWLDHVIYSAAVGAEPFPGLRFRRSPIPSVIVGAEGRRGSRLTAWARHNQIEMGRAPIRFIEQSMDLRTPGADIDRLLEQLARAAEQIGDLGIVGIDTLSRTFGAGVENKAEDMGQYYEHIDRIARETGAATIVVHHFGKDEEKGGRGSGLLAANIDFEIQIKRGRDGVRTAKATKQRDGPDGAELSFRLEVVDLGPHPNPDAGADDRWTSCVVSAVDGADSGQLDARPRAAVQSRPGKPPAGTECALRALRAAISDHSERLPETSSIPVGSRGVSAETWRARFYALAGEEFPDMRQDTRLKRFNRSKDKLIDIGMVMATGPWVWISN